MIWFLHLPVLALAASFVTYGLAAVPPDPCDPLYHTELNEALRSTGYKVTSPTQIPLCDMDLSPGWYRFTSQAGGTIPTTCPSRFQCGTVVPIWMNGKLPTVAEGQAVRQMCANFNNNCCELKLNVLVKNCGQFFVYYLYPTPSCPISYCAGGVAPCPFGQWSLTGFPPGCKDAFPTIAERPKLWGPVVEADNKSFILQCEIIYPDKDPDQAFEAVWTFNGDENPNITPQILTDPDRLATLDGRLLAGHLDTDVECKIRAYYIGNEGHKGPFLRSDAYYAGIQIDPPKLIVSETDSEKEINITSTIPIVCDHDLQCCLNFQLDMSSDKDAVVPNKCIYELCTEDWDALSKTAITEIPVVATQDMVKDDTTSLLLTFEELKPFGLGSYMDVFSGYRPPQVQIDIPDWDTSICSITGDPHFYGFDSGPYHLYLTGDFTVVKIDTRHFEVQIRTWPCNFGADTAVTCICGVVVREGNDVIRVDQCDQVYGGRSTQPRITTPRKLGEGTIVKRKQDGYHIGIYLLSGTEIKLDTTNTYMNMIIKLPGTDFGQARGLCGTNDGIRGNEFTYPDGRLDPVCSDCIPNNFMEAWRASPEHSLFVTLPDLVPEEDNVKYCVCEEKDGKHIATCDTRAKVPGTDLPCHDCQVIDPPIDLGGWHKRKREELYEDTDILDDPYVQQDLPPVDPNKQWPNSKGVTESQAREMCSKAVGKSPLSSKGGEMQDLYDSTIKNCMSDILFGETTQFLDSITEAFTAQTQQVLAKDPANYVSDAEGKTVLKHEYLDDICDLKCDEHGQCGKGGVCVCEDGWEGVNCHIQSGIGPQMDKLRLGPLCDTGEKACTKIFADVSNVDLSNDLLCRVQKVDEQGINQGQPVDTDVESFSAFRIACILPKTTVSSQRYKISASNDGSLFGNEKTLRVFDSTCMDCNETSCTAKNTACHIGNVCYEDGHMKIDDQYRICDITKDTTDWTILPKPTTESPVQETALPTTTESKTTVPQSTTTVSEVDLNNFCSQKPTGTTIYPHPYDCTKFIQCNEWNTGTFIVDCPRDMLFNPELKVCDHPTPALIASCQTTNK